jgi:poly-beta-1,6-N-acetyl-D-glucosamine synthase
VRNPADDIHSYAVVTPVRNESANLGRIASALRAQTLLPARWGIVDTGSTDDTLAVADELAAELPWVIVRRLPIPGSIMRGGPIVHAFHAGLADVPEDASVVLKLDADISMEPDYFARLLEEFARDPRLGIASGVCHELQPDGTWRERHGTGAGVWGACRAYRRECLNEIVPLEERMGWDTIDAVAAAVRGWSARVVPTLPFFHHREEGGRDRSRYAHWYSQGGAAHYMGYRFSYLAFRTMYRLLGELAAVGLLAGYLDAARRHEPKCADAAVRAYVRSEQSFRKLPRRAKEALQPRRRLDRTAEYE